MELDSYYDRLISKPFEIFLAMESEWGRSNSERATRHEVLEEAIKLAIVRARAKVVIFGPTTADQANRLFAEIETLRNSAGDPRPWLFVSNPWRERAVEFRVLKCPMAHSCANCAFEAR